MSERIAVLTEGRTDPVSAKTAVSLLLYRPEDVVALIDSQAAGKTAQQMLKFGGETPIVASLGEAGRIDALYIGVAPAGGKLPPEMRSVVLEAAGKGVRIVSGLHQFLVNDPDIVEAAKRGGAELFDVRKNSETDVADRKGLDPRCLKVHTVGNDCSVGKMMTAVELTRGLKARGADAKFVATGQTGIMVEGDGCPVDCVVADFINGACEKLVKANQHHDILVIEGQATLAHPSYSSVTYGLLHGTLPDGLIMTYEAQRPHMTGRPHLPIMPMGKLIKLYEHVANLEQPCRFIGVAINSRRLNGDVAAIDRERDRIQHETGLPACDVLVHGTDVLVEATLKLKAELGKGH